MCSSDLFDDSKSLYGVNGAGVTHDYVAIVRDYDARKKIATVEVRNVIDIGDKLEVFGPKLENSTFINNAMYDLEWNYLEEAHRPTQLIYIRLPFTVSVNDMVRKCSC